MTLWLTADQHFGHRNILKYSARPFASLEDMHEALVSRHNALVGVDDDVWHLGDFALDERLVRTFLPRLRGRHHLVAGNHDKCHPCHRRHASSARSYVRDGFLDVHESTTLGDFLVCHLPYTGDTEHEEHYGEFRPADDGQWLLHGHVHELWKVRDRMINVGVDQWDYAPVALSTLEGLR